MATFEQVYKNWKEVFQCSGDCNGGSDVCLCRFTFDCEKCGKETTIYGEDMPETNDFGGFCFSCIAKEHFV